MSHTNSQRKQLNLVQLFRGLAAILVLLYHGTTLFALNTQQVFLDNIFKFAHTGVNFFFVLSGFIIFYIHRHDIGKKVKFTDFIIKRFTRVYPIYWIILIPKLLFDGKDINFLMAISALALFPYPNPPVINVSWTLSYEIFFYLIVSLAILVGFKYLKPILITWIAFVCLYSFNILSLPEDNLFLNFIFSYHHLEFCFGCIAAYIVTKHKVKQSKFILVLGLVLFSLSSIATVYTTQALAANTSASPYIIAEKMRLPMEAEYSFIYYGIPSMLIVLGAASLDLKYDIKVPKPLLYLGDASYSIYLIHGFVLNFATKIVDKSPIEQLFQSDAAKFSIIIISLFVGCLFHTYVEMPLLTIIKKKILVYKNASTR